MRLALMALASVLIVGCSDNQTARGDAANDGGNATATADQVAGEQAIALGLTRDQLEDADILDATGREIADVERVVTDASGAVTGLLVEIEDSDPDRYVTISLDGLSVVQDGDDRDLRGSMTRDQLMALPETAR